MTLIYRTVPSFSSTLKRFGLLNKDQENLEGIMYDLGYISFEDVSPFFEQNGEETLNTFKLLDDYYKFFFLFPYDALINTFFSIEGYCYDKFHFELLEYDIPTEILLKYCGYGFYRDYAHVEFCIPESEFQKFSLSTIDIKELEKELSNYKELNNVSCYENKRIYKTNFITGKRNLYDTSELYAENKILTFAKIIEQLNKKGIISSSNIVEVYELFKRQANDVYRDKEYEVKKLKKTLEKVLYR